MHTTSDTIFWLSTFTCAFTWWDPQANLAFSSIHLCQAYFLDAFPAIQLNWSWQFLSFSGNLSLSLPSKVHPILQYTSIYPTLRTFDQGVRYCTHCVRLYGSKKPKWLNWRHNDLKKLCFIIRDWLWVFLCKMKNDKTPTAVVASTSGCSR